MRIAQSLESLRAETVLLSDESTLPENIARLDFRLHGDGAHIFFFGSPFGAAYECLMEALCREPIASSLLSLCLDGPDEGANGTRNWDLSSMARSPTDFPALRHLLIPQGQPHDHNRTIVAGTYDEDGVIGDLVIKAPCLESLVSPSAPFKNFFEKKLEKLAMLSVDAGYDTQNFIQNLASSDFAPNLRTFCWGEYAETYLDGWVDEATPFSSMIDLFRSSVFETVKWFLLKNPVYSDEELRQLVSLRPSLQFMIVRTYSAYQRS